MKACASPGPSIDAVSRVPPADHGAEEWVLLPGLFSWAEVCSLFSAETGRDDEWRFTVRRVFREETDEPLYSVCAAHRLKIFERKKR